MKKTLFFVGVLVIIVGFLWQVGLRMKDEKVVEEVSLGKDPQNSTYILDNEKITLVNGSFESDSDSKMIVKNFGEPVYGDLNDDGKDDAVLMLTQDSGGSGTFYYVGVALNSEDKGFAGTNLILLGDRISPQNIEIKNGIAIANYAERKEGDPFTTSPSVGVSKYMFVEESSLEEVIGLQKGETVLWGGLVWGGEVRTFIPCGDGNPEYWITGSSTALQEIKSRYETETKDVLPKNYAPLFSVIVGKIVDAPEDGFGADYQQGIEISQVIKTSRSGNCKSDLIVLDTPLVGSEISSPLKIEGRARGTWFFEASFPITLTDWDGRIIAQGIATATDDWMTEKFVPFTANLEFENPQNIGDFSRRGALILQKDNPSGLPEHDDALEVTVYFK
ncbi:TPA: hypothetical protein DCZ46_00045 [Candidatus Campbellbacteria bacterium]|nr:MAG: hypothetical protein UR58_C0001G0370 [Candidatus Campbellbacteria bacterium GW2011_OD1_34_28]KKP74640.1 MAG: hypothetical protein UR74_C0003G0050 [Candidatus Campbellbacteria bacterium GW2011_GWD2_35_24]KKP76772.1 MAG: hypothetical protein UR76_C0003G0050 [Candidatus Campbellbacteria bacterium GW2011_GWC1_35_31]KKP78657.1 MAG: hypothetical protein UR79_C0003G0011 [Candidatus Campbellbacteria bacterium GW2011_GWD1_35_49]HAP74399.1 hypothetical protein [Candidatus Campbellbacteria bacteri